MANKLRNKSPEKETKQKNVDRQKQSSGGRHTVAYAADTIGGLLFVYGTFSEHSINPWLAFFGAILVLTGLGFHLHGHLTPKLLYGSLSIIAILAFVASYHLSSSDETTEKMPSLFIDGIQTQTFAANEYFVAYGNITNDGNGKAFKVTPVELVAILPKEPNVGIDVIPLSDTSGAVTSIPPGRSNSFRAASRSPITESEFKAIRDGNLKLFVYIKLIYFNESGQKFIKRDCLLFVPTNGRFIQCDHNVDR